MFSCLQILEAFLWFVLITLLNVTLIILTLSVSRLLNLLLRLVAFLLFLNPQCLASISRWIRSEERFSRNAETDLVCRLLLEKKKEQTCGQGTMRRYIRKGIIGCDDLCYRLTTSSLSQRGRSLFS